jgi:bifunctional non-homologous end joining protein LigD
LRLLGLSLSTTMKSTTLYYREGSSDKVYQAAIEPKNNLFIVTFAFGRRGTTLQTGVKTPTPVDLPTAERLFEKLVREKTSKGYTQIESSTPYTQPDQAQSPATNIRPQLLNAIDEAEASKLISSTGWCMQEKKDGRRLIIKKDGAAIHGINRRGLLCGLPSSLLYEIQKIEGDFIIDGEIVGEVFHAFDILLWNDQTWMLCNYQRRLDALDDLLQGRREHVRKIDTIYDEIEKLDRVQELRKSRAEGVVFKLLSAPYGPGRPNTGGPALKYKFTTTASCIVAGLSIRKRSVQLALLNDGGNKANAGNVTIPPNYPIPKVGDVVELPLRLQTKRRFVSARFSWPARRYQGERMHHSSAQIQTGGRRWSISARSGSSHWQWPKNVITSSPVLEQVFTPNAKRTSRRSFVARSCDCRRRGRQLNNVGAGQSLDRPALRM